MASITGLHLWEPDWAYLSHLHWAPNFDVADCLDGGYLGPFTFLGLTAMLKKTPKLALDNGAYYLLFENVPLMLPKTSLKTTCS